MSTILGGTLIGGKHWENKLKNAFEQWAAEDINNTYWNDQFKEDIWPYDKETRRKNGDIARPPDRDIYDLGALYDSGRRNFKITQGSVDITASWVWDAKNTSGGAYAWYVHEGLSTNIEPRKWTDELQEPNRFAASALKEALLGRIKAAMVV